MDNNEVIIIVNKVGATGRGRPSRVSLPQRNWESASALRIYLKSYDIELYHYGRFISPVNLQYLAEKLMDGYRFYVKYARGRNVAQVTDFELNAELQKLNLERYTVNELVVKTALFCVSMEDGAEEGAGNFPQRLQGSTVELSELAAMDPLGGFNRMLDDFIRFKAMLIVLRRLPETLMFRDEPVAAVSGDKVRKMLAIRESGISIGDLQGVVEFWKSGDFQPPVKDQVVQLTDLIAAAKDEGII